MHVYRLETKEGYGPLHGVWWASDSQFEEMEEIFSDYIKKEGTANHPIPEEDGLGYVGDDEICGCISLKQLYS